MVITGGGNGIMEAGHLGAGRENSIGLNILLPFEQHPNTVILDDPKLMHLRYFFTRKLLFVKECEAVALFPGGFGTLDEGFEVLTLVQTGKSHLFPIVMIDAPGSDYWQHFLRFTKEVLLARKLISADDLHLFKVTNSVEEAVARDPQLLSRLSQHEVRQGGPGDSAQPRDWRCARWKRSAPISPASSRAARSS